MELMIPSLMALLIAVAIAYFVMPKFAPSVLVTSSMIVLGLALFTHMKQFGVSEYERATWIYKIKDYGSYIMIGVVLLGTYGFYAMNNMELPGPVKNILPSMSSPSMPALSFPMSGGGMDTVAKTVTSRIGQLLKKGRISFD
jgi:hypothetical protein